MSEPVAVYKRVIQHFTELVDSITPDQWSAPTPCEGWAVRDLIKHVILRDRRLAESVGDVPAQTLASENDGDLQRQWHERADWWAAGLSDPQRRDEQWDTPMGEMTFGQATTMLMTGELTIHGWDLARALGADETMDLAAARTTLEQMREHDEQLRQPGAIGPQVQAPPGSDEQTQLLAFTGRTA